jgi:hypothetical protein
MKPWLTTMQPWTGLVLGVPGWFLHHQLGADIIFHDCQRGGPGLTVVLGLVCGAVVALGGGLSWAARPPDQGATGQNRRFAAYVGAGCAGLFLLAIIFQSLTGVIVPTCYR